MIQRYNFRITRIMLFMIQLVQSQYSRVKSESITSGTMHAGGSSLDASRHPDGHVRASFLVQVARVSFCPSLHCFFLFS